MREETVAGMIGAPVDDKVALFESLGVPPEIGQRVAVANDETMGRCILALYRSAGPADLAPIWEALPSKAATVLGMVIVPTADHYIGPLEFSYAVAERGGAETATFDGLGHWWMLEDPDQAAEALDAFWREKVAGPA